MTDAVETMAYTKSGGVPWHGMGNPVDDTMSPEEMMVASKTDWTVSLRDMFWKPDGSKIEKVLDKRVLARDSDNQQLSVVGTHWKPVQNIEAVTFFKKFVAEGKMHMETMGSLWSGRYIWALARLKNDFALGKGSDADEVRGYVLLCSPHTIGKAMLLQTTGIRVVCWNTLQMALGASLKGDKGKAFRMPHSMAFDDEMKGKAAEALGLASAQIDEFKEAATLLATKKATPEHVEEFFCEVLRYDPKDAEKEEKREPRMLKYFANAMELAPGADLASARGTWWGALNAVTRVVDHDLGRERETALKTAWFGGKAALKRRALDLAIVAANSSGGINGKLTATTVATPDPVPVAAAPAKKAKKAIADGEAAEANAAVKKAPAKKAAPKKK
jgi:phage/plasmid-like protein (TIGR03299 family)